MTTAATRSTGATTTTKATEPAVGKLLLTPLRVAAFISGSIYLAFAIASLVLYSNYIHSTVRAASVISICSCVSGMVWLAIDPFLAHKVKWLTNRKRNLVSQCLLLLNLAALVVSAAQTIQLSLGPWGHPQRALTVHGTNLAVTDSFGLFFSALFSILFCQLSWWPAPRAGRTTMMICGVLEFILGTLIIALNYEAVFLSGTQYRWGQFYQHTGSVVVGLSMIGLVLCIVIRESDRLNPIYARLIQIYLAVTVVTFIVVLVYFAAALKILNASALENDDLNWTFYHANIALSAALIAMLVAHSVAALKLQQRPPSHLKVEELDLAGMTPKQLDAYASVIDKFGKTYAGAPSGKNAMSLMQAYMQSNGTMEGVKCVVLRVFKGTEEQEQFPLSKKPIPRSYDEIVAWKHLDRGTVMPENNTPDEKDIATKMPSKNQLKRMQKKSKKQKNVEFPLEDAQTPAEIQAEVEFNQKVMATEALVLLTSIEQYDLTDTVRGKFGIVLRKTLGSQSWFKPLVVRMGLLAFHWPFRQSTFYCGLTDKPVARSAAVLRAVTEWNKSLPRSERCVVMMDPRYENDSSERAIVPSGWHPTRLPSSHIADLRPYAGKTLQEYLKAIKYRNQDTAFTNANGTFEEYTEFDDDACQQVIKLWSKIAEKRTGEGHTAVLAEPTPEFIYSLQASDGFRSLLFLKVNNEPIASCVLFRLGDTITSDLQGLDHDNDKARQYKAYFVMMQHSIDVALNEGMSFVDFGPTTAKPKLAIGCQSVPLMGGIKATSPVLNVAIKVAAGKVST